MNKRYHGFRLFLFAFLALTLNVSAQDIPGMAGNWQLIPGKSDSGAFYHAISLHIQGARGRLELVQKWGDHFSFTDSVNLPDNGKAAMIRVDSRIWPYQVFMGVSMIPGSEKKVTAQWLNDKKTLQVDETYPVLVSQGKVEIHGSRVYTLSEDGEKLTMDVQRDSRSPAHLTYVFRRAAIHHAYSMRLSDHWEVDGRLSDNAFLLSLQGIANDSIPRLYFVYPPDYDYRFTPHMLDFYQDHLGYSFTEISTMKDALEIFKKGVKGYIIWDKFVRGSLNVAFTLAGLEKAVVITPEMIPMMNAAGIKEIADFRGKFTGMTDVQIYSWAYDQYWQRCNKEYIVWMGGVSGNQMVPGIADFGVSKGSFFTDLSTDPKDTAEYALANKIFSHMPPLSMVMGWHSYAKDLERNYVTLASHYALRVEGLNTFPNLSFTSRTPPSRNFTFKNHHTVVPGKAYTPGKKVYIACVQTDGLGLGAWTKPGRGSIPYAWEVTINWQWMAPVLLEFYYSTATANDYFFGSLSGPGYMYPKAIPPALLPAVIKKADDLMHKLDLNVFETMDYSEGSTVTGNTELPKYIVDAYYKYMPDAIGFLNGYAPSYTFYSKDGRPFISYDYYLDENLPASEAVADLKELMRLNDKRPYFLLLHIREWNNIDRVKHILDQLGPDTEVVPLEVFLKMAGSQPTFNTRFLEKKK